MCAGLPSGFTAGLATVWFPGQACCTHDVELLGRTVKKLQLGQGYENRGRFWPGEQLFNNHLDGWSFEERRVVPCVWLRGDGGGAQFQKAARSGKGLQPCGALVIGENEDVARGRESVQLLQLVGERRGKERVRDGGKNVDGGHPVEGTWACSQVKSGVEVAMLDGGLIGLVGVEKAVLKQVRT